MCTEGQLKVKLGKLNFSHPGLMKELELDSLINEMTLHIGSTDGELRDKLIYTSFYRLMEGNLLSTEQMSFLLDTCMDENHLFYGIGKKEDDSVFTRGFSSLVLALLLDKDRTNPFLPADKVQNAIEACFLYLEAEEDTRGYVEGKGWAHSIAHGADYLVEAIRHPSFPSVFLHRSLKTIKDCILKDAAYVDDEDGRLFFAIEILLDKIMTDDDLLMWLMDLSSTVNNRYKGEGYSYSFYRMKMNIENFFKTCYFRLKWKDTGSKECDYIEAVLEKWHNHEYN
ncbi:DUF2785 domain-containing protein [Rossellomorea arthrocnemi]|jgi:hypothetical protein|uniref:DUF2785 domain-containing protein n=1 Tax=Rossellomorea arthrocnemi TaxID=2769542 RepID=UPI0019194BF0|nr:DUF2785 domain-containing protein [Rossellomorea arthrocnemi]